jgi:hypothetical protein
MSSNYPMGAANDPRAPYNEPEWPEIEVTATATLVKETVVLGSGKHTCTECEIEPDGSRSYVSFTESDDDVRELFRDQDMTPAEIFRKCEKVVSQLVTDGHRFYAHVNLHSLLDALDGWEEKEFEVNEC